MMTSPKSFARTGAILAIASVFVLFSPEAEAATAFSFSYSEGGGRYSHSDRYVRSIHDRSRYDRHYKARHYHHPRHSRAATTIIYRSAPVIYRPAPVVVSQPIYYQAPAPLLANQTSPTYVSTWGQTCREYQTQSVIGGVVQAAYGTACLQPDGSWRVTD